MDTDVNASLRGRVAFVTDASSGMGRHFSALLAGHGAAVALVARRLDALEEISASIQATGARAIPIACDIADRDAVRAAVNRAEELLDGVPTIVVNSGGIIERIPAIEMPEEKWDRVIRTNLTGTFNVAQATATRMQQVDKGGSIVAIASIAGIRVAARAAAYAASKAGIIHLTKVLAYEWAPYGIRVNAIAPGYFETEMTQDLLATERSKAIIGRIRWGASAK